eukprot:Skav219285  [mRNA]  locus=scaffold2157:147873:150523:- [translate_table: standard]
MLDCFAGISFGGLLGYLLRHEKQSEGCEPDAAAIQAATAEEIFRRSSGRHLSKTVPEKLQNTSSLYPFKEHVESMTATVESKQPPLEHSAPARLEPSRSVTAMEDAVSGQPRSFNRRISGKFTQKLGSWK